MALAEAFAKLAALAERPLDDDQAVEMFSGANRPQFWSGRSISLEMRARMLDFPFARLRLAPLLAVLCLFIAAGSAVETKSPPAKSGPTPVPSGVYGFEPELWNQPRADFWSHRKEDQGAVVFVGDSITQGWSSLAAAFPKLKVANRGIPGDTSVGVLFRLQEDVLDLNPKAVVLLIGTNDTRNGDRDAGFVAGKIAEILDRITAFNAKLPIVVCHVMPRGLQVGAFPDKLIAINQLIDKRAAGRPNVGICDTWAIYAQKDGSCLKEEFPDLLHPNAAGYQKWADALKPLFQKCKLIP